MKSYSEAEKKILERCICKMNHLLVATNSSEYPLSFDEPESKESELDQ